MKKIIAAVALLIFSVGVFANEADSLWRDAVNAYSGGDYEVSLRSFEQLERDGYSSAELYYNIGNCYYKMDGYLGKAILYYERALLKDPSFEDAAVNLDIANELTLDKIETVPEFVLVTYVGNIMRSATSDFWAICSIVLFVLTAVLLLGFRFARSISVRKISFAVAIITLLFSIFTFIFSVRLNKIQTGDNYAIVLSPVASVKSSPSVSEQSLFILHEGTKVEVLDVLGDWVRVKLSDGRQGWSSRSDIEII